MPDFLYKSKRYYNPVEFAMDRIGGTWKMPILWRLKDRVMRYSELKRDIDKQVARRSFDTAFPWKPLLSPHYVKKT